MSAEFRVEPAPGGALLTVVQDGFPMDPVADEFYAACERGWLDSLASMQRYVAAPR